MSPYSRFDRDFHDLHGRPRRRPQIEVDIEVVSEDERPRVQPARDFWRTMAWAHIAFLILLVVICLGAILIGASGLFGALMFGVLTSDLKTIAQAFVNLG